MTTAITAAREALDRIMIGGNHLASALIGILGPKFPESGSTREQVEAAIKSGDFRDLWVCWDVIMQERETLAHLRAAEAERGWRPIAEAPKDSHVIVGKLHRGKWEWKPTQFVNVAMEDGYTHYLVVPPPPAKEGK